MDFELNVTLSPSVYQRTFSTLRTGKCLTRIFLGVRKKSLLLFVMPWPPFLIGVVVRVKEQG